MFLDTDTLPRAATTLLDLILTELDDPKPQLVAGTGLPAGAVDLLDHNLTICATPVVIEPMFRGALHRACASTHRDVLLVRHGFHPEVLDPVEVDLAIRTTGGPLLIEGMSFLRHRDGSLHLVPRDHDLFAEITSRGIDLSMVPPYDLWDERTEGLTRAAAEIVRAGRGERA